MTTKNFSPKHINDLISFVMTNGVKQSSERGDTYEVLGMSLKTTNPLNRFDTTRARKLNVAFAFAEWISLMTGENSIKFFTNFIKMYGEYSTDGIVLDGAYGDRIKDDIRECANLILKTPDTRRAVITVYNGKTDLRGGGGKNTPCTVSYHFMKRDGRLHLFTHMRSNDIIFGLTNDVVVNTMLLEWMALKTRSSLGSYYHYADTLHVYVDTLKKVEYKEEGRWPHVVGPMPIEMTNEAELEALRNIYMNCYEPFPLMQMQVESLSTSYSRDIGYTALAYANRKQSPSHAVEALKKIEDMTIKRLVRPWVVK